MNLQEQHVSWSTRARDVPVELFYMDAKPGIALLRVGNIYLQQLQYWRDICYDNVCACAQLSKKIKRTRNGPSIARAMPSKPVPAPSSKTFLPFHSPTGNALLELLPDAKRTAQLIVHIL